MNSFFRINHFIRINYFYNIAIRIIKLKNDYNFHILSLLDKNKNPKAFQVFLFSQPIKRSVICGYIIELIFLLLMQNFNYYDL